jgi:hypothetical protein
MKVDESMWPIVVFTVGETTTDDDWRRMFATYDEIYKRHQLFHTITDGMSIKSFPTSAQRKLIADLSREHEARSRRWCVGGATVLPNAVARGVVTAVTWLAPPVYKLTYHESFADALDEAVRALAARGITVPEGALRAHRPARTGTR